MGGLNKDVLVFDTGAPDDSDNVGAYLRSSDGTLITHTTIGSKEALDVNVVGGSDSGIFAEDSVHVSGDNGQFILAVQTAAQGALAADGDYAPLQVDSQGRLRVMADLDLVGDLVADDEVDSEDPLKVGSRAVSGALAAISASGDKANVISDMYRRVYINDSPNIGAAVDEISVATTETALPASALAGRRRMIIQNMSAVLPVYIGPTGVTTADGLEIPRRSSLSLEIGQNVALFGIVSAGTASVRVFELA